MISGPEASIGNLLHRVLEQANRTTGDSLEDLFQSEYERAVTEIKADPRRSHFAELAATKSLVEWTRIKTWVLARAEREAGTGVTTERRLSTSSRVTGTEVELKSSKLRLRGRADKIRQLAPGIFEIKDFKTGATLDTEGQLKLEIALQLKAYGLLLLDCQKVDEVRLVVDDGEERPVPFDADDRQDAMVVIKGIIDSLPPAGTASAKELANPGQSCWGCSTRHICPAYRATAPTWWKGYPQEVDRLPNDIWGTIIEVTGSIRQNVVMLDESGRRVRIDNLDSRHGDFASLRGRRIWFFGLNAIGQSRGFDGVRFHPRSFYELPRDRMERRAWTLETFEKE